MIFRPERPGDIDAIRRITRTAFAGKAYSDGDEVELIDRLRAQNGLTLSLVVEDDGRVIGHIAASPATVTGSDEPWYGIGPVTVAPPRQGEGIGSQLMREGLHRLKITGAGGCILVGDPGFYGRFGFRVDPAISWHAAPDGYLQSLLFSGPAPAGEVGFHPAFDPKD